jgi:RNA polymerase sigma factor (sigma-70 family)
MTQINPLADYAKHRSPDAFAQIVEQYQRLILATCRRKLHHPADLDDAVQETFLRLAQNAGTVRNNVGGWLYTCAVNVAIDINRRQSSRHRHESAAAMPSQTPDEPQQQLAELREHLDAALLKLEPAERELIIQRYFVGRPQVELAADAGVSASAISHRLDQAIENLRRHLSARGCAITAAAGLTALLETEHASAAPPPSLTANVMKIGLSGIPAAAGYGWAAPTAQVAAIAAVFVIAAGLWIALRHSHSPAVQTTAPAPGPSGMVVDQNPQSPSAPAPKWQPALQGATTAVLSGRVVDGDGNPVAGATVRLDGPASAQTKSDAQGNYVFQNIGRDGDYRIGIEADGFISVLPYMSNQPDLRLTFDSKARRDLVLQRGVNLLITVSSALGETIPNVEIAAEPLAPHNTATSTAQTNSVGQTKILLPVSNSKYLVTATIDGYAPAHLVMTPSSADKSIEVNLVLDTGYTIKGVAICSDNKPAAGWTIIAKPDWWSSNSWPRGVPIDKDGNFTLKDMGSGVYNFCVEIPHGDTSQSIQVATLTMPPTTQPMRLDLPMLSPASAASQAKFAGRIRFIGGRPGFESIMVNVMSLTDNQFFNGMIEPNGNGQRGNEIPFDIGAVPPGTYRITFESTEIEQKVLEKVQWPSKLPVIELKIIGKPHLIGTVVDAATGNPITQYAIRVGKAGYVGDGPNWGQDEHWTQVSDVAGHFDIELIGPGIYIVQVSIDGYAWMSSQPVTVESATGIAPIKLKATSGGSLAGSVLDPSGKPVAGAMVIPLSKAHSASNADHFESQAGAATTDTHGTFLLQHLAAGSETLKIIHPDFAPLIVGNLKIVEGQTTHAPSTNLLVGGSVDGIAFDGQGQPTANATLIFQDDQYWHHEESPTSRMASVVTDDQGHFHVDHLPHQPIWVQFADMEYRPGILRRVVLPIEGRTARLDIGGPMAVSGRLLSAGKPVPNKRLELAVQSPNWGPVIDCGQTDADGRFIFYGPPPGRYTLFCDNDARGWDWIGVRTVQVGDKPMDLGDVVFDVGAVGVIVKADDPKELADVDTVTIEPTWPTGLDFNMVSANLDDAATNVWRAKNIPLGRLRAAVQIKGDPGITFAAPFERSPGALQTDVIIQLAHRSATLKISATKPIGDNDVQYFRLANQDGTVRMDTGLQPQASVLKLPPGTYRPTDLTTNEPFADFTPIVLTDGQTCGCEIDPATFGKATAAARVSVNVWTADGVLVAGPMLHLIDGAGNRIEPYEDYNLGQRFFAGPAHYHVLVDRAGTTPLNLELSLPASGQSVDLIEP